MTTKTSFLRAGTAALLLAAAWGCDQAPLTAPEAAGANVIASTGDELEIHVATLQWLIANKSATGLDAQCVSTGFPDADVDAGTDLLARFAGRTPPVVAYSSCTIAVTGDTYNPTGGFAEWFFLGTPAISGTRAEVDAGFHLNGRLSERFHCFLRQTGATWAIRRCDLTFAA
jgi:hypothetical protein